MNITQTVSLRASGEIQGGGNKPAQTNSLRYEVGRKLTVCATKGAFAPAGRDVNSSGHF
jgi:hypothetical protein